MKKIIALCLLLVCISFGQDMIVRVYAPSKLSLKVLSPKYNLDIAAARAGTSSVGPRLR